MTGERNRDREHALECTSISRYLVGLDPDAYLVEKYARFAASETPAAGLLDLCCAQLLRLGPTGARMVDSYCSRFRRRGPAFRKLVGMLALLECRPASSDRLDLPYSGGAALVIAKLMVRGSLDVLTLLVAVLLLAPLHLLQRMTSRKDRT